ncbi:MAG: hypothetical protein ACLRNQ_29280 [Flavonifractor plautii]
MDGDTRVIDYVKEIGNRIETGAGMLTASQLLEQFLFPAEAQWSPIRKLSGGEKRRLFLLSVLAAAPNVLCCWTSRPTIWIFRPSACWRTIWTPSPARWWRCPTTAISWTGWCGGCSPWRGTEASGVIPAGIRSIWRPGGPLDSLARSPKPAEPKAARSQGAKS